MKYIKKEERIVFDHLVPPNKDLVGLEEYYIPGGTFNAYEYKDKEWWLLHDIDIKNTQKGQKIKKPKRGLIPN